MEKDQVKEGKIQENQEEILSETPVNQEEIFSETPVNPEEIFSEETTEETSEVVKKPEPQPAELPPEECGSLVGKVFVGIYLFIYGWFLLHTLVYFWDIFIPWNISWGSHFYFNGAFLFFVVLLICIFSSLLAIWSLPSLSTQGAMRWFLMLPLNLSYVVFWLSNMGGEPFSVIGSGWFGRDLRYPEFLSQPSFIFLHVYFLSDMVQCFQADEDSMSKTYMFRPFRSHYFDYNYKDYKENLMGILACGYIYFSYLFIIMVVSRSWIERIIIILGLFVCRNCFGKGKDFEGFKTVFFLSFVPVLACVRMYYAYYEWNSLGSTFVYLLNLTWVFTQIAIFAGWYSHPKSTLAKLCVPFPRVEHLEVQKEE